MIVKYVLSTKYELNFQQMSNKKTLDTNGIMRKTWDYILVQRDLMPNLMKIILLILMIIVRYRIDFA
jgi:hypothetical protein